MVYQASDLHRGHGVFALIPVRSDPQTRWVGAKSGPARSGLVSTTNSALPDLTSPLPTEQAAQTGQVPGQQVPIPHTLAHF